MTNLQHLLIIFRNMVDITIYSYFCFTVSRYSQFSSHTLHSSLVNLSRGVLHFIVIINGLLFPLYFLPDYYLLYSYFASGHNLKFSY